MWKVICAITGLGAVGLIATGAVKSGRISTGETLLVFVLIGIMLYSYLRVYGTTPNTAWAHWALILTVLTAYAFAYVTTNEFEQVIGGGLTASILFVCALTFSAYEFRKWHHAVPIKQGGQS